MTPRLGVLVLSHGTPPSLDDVAPFYTRIRRGSPPSSEQLAELVGRYAAIGGTSPLTERTAAQVDGLRRTLDARGLGAVVEGGTKYATPTIEEACDRLVLADVDHVVGIVLSPLDATTTTDQYHDRALAAIGGRAPYRAVRSWWQTPGFTALLAARVRAVRATGPSPLVLFTAHSLPVRVDPEGRYRGELAAAAAAIAELGGIEDYLVCWQSAGRTADEWLGPDVLEVVDGLEPDSVSTVVVCPVGFVSDHLEVVYDLDVEAAQRAAARGLTLTRTDSLNDDDEFVAILADVVEAAGA
ncbi:MAG TPA: ferrochelatase [Acidimicrobiales bacterium]|nr:ferrochelatase [Acidimicrobiales bacterium]